MSTNDGFEGVSKCYVFKSQLQEYAQKVGLPTPIYETIKEGPSHEPFFRSAVIVNNVRYDSLPGFFNRKAAEQSAAEVALLELAKSGDMDASVSQPVYETGLCKNLLQEYAQKMNYAIPSYECQKDEKPGRMALFSCTVEIGGIKYIGAAARTKKEAEIKAARTALLAIRSSPTASNEKHTDSSLYTVVPWKKKVTDVGTNPQETAAALKPKKGRFKKKLGKKRHAGNSGNNIQLKNTTSLEVHTDGWAASVLGRADASEIQAADSGLLTMEAMQDFQNGTSKSAGEEAQMSATLSSSSSDHKVGQLTAMSSDRKDLPNIGIGLMFCGDDLTALVKEVNNKISGVGQVASMVNNFSTCHGEVPGILDGLKQMTYGDNAGSNQG